MAYKCDNYNTKSKLNITAFFKITIVFNNVWQFFWKSLNLLYQYLEYTVDLEYDEHLIFSNKSFTWIRFQKILSSMIC